MKVFWSLVGLLPLGLLLGAKGATAPAFVQHLRPENLGEPSFFPCVEAPQARAARTPAPEETEATLAQKYPGWMIVDTTPGATNEGIPAEILAKLSLTVSPEQLPAQPLSGNAADIAKIHAVFDRAAAHKAVVRMAVWGDSHTTGDNLPGQLRRIFQTRYGDAGTGFVMPFGVFADSAIGRTVSCEQGWTTEWVDARPVVGLGPSGAAGTATSPDARAWVLVEEEVRPKAKMWISVLYQKQPEGGTLRVKIDQAEEIRLPTKGEAGPAVAELELPMGPHRLELAPAGDGTVRVNGVTVERQSVAGGGIVVDALGAPGRGYSVFKSWDLASMQQWTSWRPYDLWVIVAGSGDGRNTKLTEEEFRATLHQSLKNLRSFSPDAACLLLGPADRGRPLDNNTVLIWGNHEMMNRVVRELGPQYGCATFSFQELMGGLGGTFSWVRAGLMLPDYLHLTRSGYRVLGSRLAELLDP
ncbi:MAG TPA: hypothetical protein PKY30_03665 [Myxococcota bacterium]|nr:hypothetical protein [Myxococcota bacterium]